MNWRTSSTSTSSNGTSSTTSNNVVSSSTSTSSNGTSSTTSNTSTWSPPTYGASGIYQLLQQVYIFRLKLKQGLYTTSSMNDKSVSKTAVSVVNHGGAWGNICTIIIMNQIISLNHS